jgi:adenine-specific DNA-methyltransferase
VIGNPPWGSGLDNDLEILKRLYPETTAEHTDSFKIFVDLGLRLCRDSGTSAIIIPNTILRQKRLRDVRALLLKKQLISVVNLGENIFEHVIAPSCIIITRKSSEEKSELQYHDISKLTKDIRGQFLQSLDAEARIYQTDFLKNQELEFLKSFLSFSVAVKPLSEFDFFILKDVGIQCQRTNVGKEARAKSDLAQRIFIDNKINSASIMYWKGRDFDKYYIKKDTGRYFRTDFKKFIKPNEVVYFNSGVYDKSPKLIIRQTADRIIAAYDTEKRWFDGSAIGFIPNIKSEYSILYILGLFNSNLFKWYYQELVNEEGRVFAQVKLSKVKQIPIRVIDFFNPEEKQAHDLLVQIVNKILSSKEDNPSTNTAALEKQIDYLVYQLYNLTEDEIRIIESSS